MFQILKHKLVKNLGIDYERLEKDIRLSVENTHVYTINKFIEVLKKKNQDNRDARNLKNTINDLKALRIESDYHNLQIDSIKGDSALRKSKEIIQKINKDF